MADATKQISPRVNSQLIVNHINSPVRVIGKVMGYNEDNTQMTLQATDGGSVVVLVSPASAGMTWQSGQILEVIGQAQGNQQPTVQEYTSIPFSENFDFANYEKLVQLMNGKYSSLFM